MSVDFGTLNVSLAGGATIIVGANNSNTLTLSGTQAQINAALATLSYQGDLNFNGADTLTVLSTDSAGMPLSDSDTIDITVEQDNSDPLIAVDDVFTTDQNSVLNLPAPAVLNNDIGTENSGAYTFTGAGGGTTNSFQGLAGNPTNNSASFEILFRPADITDHDVLFETGATGDGTAITLDGTTLNFEVRNTLGANNTIERASVDLTALGITDPTADFIHVVGVFTLNIQLDLYVNGSLATSISGVGLTDFAGGNNTGIGQSNGGATIGGAGNFEGDIALFQFYESALNAAEVAQNFAAARLNNGTSAVVGATLSYDLVNDPNPNDNIIPGGQFDLTLDPSVNPSDALVVTAIEGNPANVGQTITLASGALVTLNADGSFSYDPNGQFDSLAEGATAQDLIDYTISDPFGATDSATITVTITGVNDAPVNTVPGMQTVAEDTSLLFSGASLISVNDIDGNLASTQLSVLNGTLNVDLTGTGATISAGVNNLNTLTLSGTQAQINAALATLNYQGDLDFNGNDTLTVLSTDSAGTPLSDTDTVDITVTPVVDPVLVSLVGPGSVIEGEVTTDYTITLDTPVPTGNSVTVNLAYSGTAMDGTDFAGVTSVIVTGPASTATFTLATIDDALAEGAENIIIDIDSIVDTDASFEAIAEDAMANQVTTVINDQVGSDATPGAEDTVLVSIAGPGSVIEGEVTTDYTITLDTPVPAGNSVTVNLAYSGTAVDGTDFTGVTSVIVTGPASTATFTLATIDDAL